MGGNLLKVQSSDSNDVFFDVVRIPKSYRIDRNNEPIPNGTVIRIDHQGNTAFAVVRGLESSASVIKMDEFLRDRLGVKPNSQISSCGIRSATWFERVLWLWNATNPAVQVPARLAVISLGLGVLSFFIALF